MTCAWWSRLWWCVYFSRWAKNSLCWKVWNKNFWRGWAQLHRSPSVSRSLLSSKFNRHLVAGAANKGQGSKLHFFFLQWTVENSDHALLCIINIWACLACSIYPLMRNKDLLWRDLHASDNEKPREGKKALRIIQTICVHKGHESFCLNKLAIQKLRWCPTCYLLMWHEMAICQMKSCVEGRGPSTKRLNHFTFMRTVYVW